MMKLALVLLTLSALVVGCSAPDVDSSPSKPVVESELLGVWELPYKGKVVSNNPSGWGFGIERVTLFADGQYDQVFDDGSGSSYPTVRSTWRLAKNFGGQQVVLLEGRRNYELGVATAVASQPRGQTSLLVEMSSAVPFGGSKKLVLCFEEADLNLCFRGSSAAEP